MSKIILGIHTAVFSHKISQSEASILKRSTKGVYADDGTYVCKDYFNQGIEELRIKESKRKYPNAQGENVLHREYRLILRINLNLLLGDDKNRICELKGSKVRQFINKMSNILNNMLKLSRYNADFHTWQADRIDLAFDIDINDPIQYLQLLKSSLNNPPKKKLTIKPTDHSIRLCNNSYTFNCYSKQQQINDLHPENPTSEYANLLRIEKQCNGPFIRKRAKNAGDLLNTEIIIKLREGLQGDVRDFWGHIDYYDLQQNNFYSTSNNGHIDGICSILDAHYASKKTYHSFPRPHYDRKNDRYKVTLTLHKELGATRGIPASGSGKTFLDCQRKIFEVIKRHILDNESHGLATGGLLDDLSRFLNTIDSPELKREVAQYIDSLR